jgi:uncharacterized Zn finger protein
MSVDAKAVQLVDRVECVAWKDGAGAVYAVPSLTTDDFYVVTDLTRLGIGQGLRCDCPAGDRRQACAHGTAVLLRRQRAQQRREGR